MSWWYRFIFSTYIHLIAIIPFTVIQLVFIFCVIWFSIFSVLDACIFFPFHVHKSHNWVRPRVHIFSRGRRWSRRYYQHCNYNSISHAFVAITSSAINVIFLDKYRIERIILHHHPHRFWLVPNEDISLLKMIPNFTE